MSEPNTCTCGEEYIEWHACPYLQEMNDDDETLCDYYGYCTRECAMDI